MPPTLCAVPKLLHPAVAKVVFAPPAVEAPAVGADAPRLALHRQWHLLFMGALRGAAAGLARSSAAVLPLL